MDTKDVIVVVAAVLSATVTICVPSALLTGNGVDQFTEASRNTRQRLTPVAASTPSRYDCPE